MIKNFFEQFLFFPNKDIKKNPSFIGIDYENVDIIDNNKKYHGWFIRGDNKTSLTQDKCILFFHGNAGNISFRLGYIEKFYELGFSLLFFDYPGFGLSEGVPNEEVCIKSADLFYNYLINEQKFINNQIIFYGESIGGSIASSLANKYNIKFLILQSTFTDIKEIIKNIIKIPFFNTLGFGFETIQNLKIRHKLNFYNKKMGTLIIHSNDDELIDISHAKKLFAYSNKLYISNGTHSNINIDSDFIFNLLSFIKDFN